MLLYVMLYILLACLTLFAAINNAVCTFFFFSIDLCKCFFFHALSLFISFFFVNLHHAQCF